MPQTGDMEVGRLPVPADAQHERRNVLSILDKETQLIGHDFVIVNHDSEGLCFPEIS